jgi:hypothetical protein
VLTAFEPGHSQKEYETHHGSMLNVRWSIDGPDEEGLEVEGRRFSTNDEGAPMMCNLVCKALGRHPHIEYCRAETPDECRANHEIQHIPRTLKPEPDKPKDFVTHNLFWKHATFVARMTEQVCLRCLQYARARLLRTCYKEMFALIGR